jgi:hypothetical protein
MLVADVGPSRMRPIINLHDFGDLWAKIIIPSFSPLQEVLVRFKKKKNEKIANVKG